MVRLSGEKAHSKGWLANLLAHLQKRLPMISDISAMVEYYLEEDDLHPEKITLIQSLLKAKEPSPTDIPPTFWIVPKLYPSSWSIEARNVLNRLDIGKVKLERLIAFNVKQSNSFEHKVLEECLMEAGVVGLDEQIVYTVNDLFNLPFSFSKYVSKKSKLNHWLAVFNQAQRNSAIWNQIGCPLLQWPMKTTFSLLNSYSLSDIIEKILTSCQLNDKSFLISLFDRNQQGLMVRDYFVGPLQVAIPSCLVWASNFKDVHGEAISWGERKSLMQLNPPAGTRLSMLDAILNLLASDVQALEDIHLNYQSNSQSMVLNHSDFWKSFSKVIPGCKLDNLEAAHFFAKAKALIRDVRKLYSPSLNVTEKSQLLLIDLTGKKRLGGSIVSKLITLNDKSTPDLEDYGLIRQFFKALTQLKNQHLIWAYHTRSEGGLLKTLCEMAFASNIGLHIDLSHYCSDWPKKGIASLFNEELGVVIQVPAGFMHKVKGVLNAVGLNKYTYPIAELDKTQTISIKCQENIYFSASLIHLKQCWSKVSEQFQTINPLKKPVNDNISALHTREPHYPKFLSRSGKKPALAILQANGLYPAHDLDYAFQMAGFNVHHFTLDTLSEINLNAFKGLAIGGGASFNDVFGAGRSFAEIILHNPKLSDLLMNFFHRKDTFSVGMGNGCQILAYLKKLIPGADDFPCFETNRSKRFEGRLTLVEICQSPSILLKPLIGAILPIPVAHAQGLAKIENLSPIVAMRYVDTEHQPTENYPFNPNGSPQGMTGFTTLDGRVTIIMPHAQRAFKTWQLPWHPQQWQENSPWLKLFKSAREWVK